jgi:inner membrane protein import complex subunit Tim44-like protein
VVRADPSGLLPPLPTGLTYLALRPLVVPLALFALGVGFVLWRFMGDIPSVLGMGLQVLFDGLRRREVPAPQPQAATVYPVAAGLTAIQALDPTFSEAGLRAEVQRTGGIVIAAWAQRSLDPCRTVLTDDCWTAQSAQLARPLAEGWRPFAAGVSLSDVSVVSVQTDSWADRLTVRVDLDAQPGTSKVIRGRRIGGWVEDWQLTRSRALAVAGRPGLPQSGPWLVDRMDHVAVKLERAA